MHMRSFLRLAFIPALLVTHVVGAQKGPERGPLRVDGRVTDGENKLAGAEVIVYKGNDPVEKIIADKGGRFRVWLEMDASFGFEFCHKGFVSKRLAFDTHLPKAGKGQVFDPIPMGIEVSLLEKARFDGAPTDDLDFPFAFIRFNKKTLTFEPDVEYTMGMQRVNGALLLMAARSEKE